MAICVMRNEVFYNTSKRLNIHPDNLELILHGYINKEGYKDETPSDLDIIKAVWGKPFIANEDQLNLYNSQYYNQKHFNDLESATKAYNEALKFYPKTAVSLFRENNGKYIIDIGTPIIPNQEVFYDQDGKVTLRRKFELEKEDLDTVETVIKEEWNNLPKEILDKVLNKISLYKESKTTEVRDFLPSMYFGKSNRSTIGEMLNKISRLSTDREIRRIARYLISKGSNDIINNLEIIRTDERDGLRGQYLSNERIVINQAAMTGKSDKEALNNYEQTILHEIAHALTVNAYNTNPELRREALLLFNEFKTIQERYGMPSMYAAKNAKEFIAEFLGRKTFREVLMALNPTKGKKSIGEKVYDFIKKCLGISPKSDFYKRADSIISKLLDANNALYGKREDTHYNDINSNSHIDTSLNEIQRNIDTRIKEIEKYKSAHNEVMSLINIFRRDPKYSHLSRERFIGTLRRRVGQWNTSYNTNIRINDDGSISDNRLNNYENELSEIQSPGYVEKLTNQKVTEIKQKILDDALQHSKELLNPYELSENEIEGLETSLNDEVDPNTSREVTNRNKRGNNTIIKQEIEQLKKLGIKVHDVKGLTKYLKDNKRLLSGNNQLFLGKKARATYEQNLRKQRPDMSEEEIKSTLDFLHSLEDNRENTAYIKAAMKWILNNSLRLPEDNTKARQVFDVARKKHIDVMKYNTLDELITSDEMKPKEKEKPKFNPDKAKTFSNKRIITTESGRVFTIYDVEDSLEGQKEVCKALSAHYKVSPWCLSTFTATGEPTKSAKNYWHKYGALNKKIAYENNKPVAFNADQDIEGDSYDINKVISSIVDALINNTISNEVADILNNSLNELAEGAFEYSMITKPSKNIQKFIEEEPSLYKEYERKYSYLYTLNGKENSILKSLFLENSAVFDDFINNNKLSEDFTISDQNIESIKWALQQELYETNSFLDNLSTLKNEFNIKSNDNREAWWDMADQRAQDTLSDNILNEEMLNRDSEFNNPLDFGVEDFDDFNYNFNDDTFFNEIELLEEQRRYYENMGIPIQFIDLIQRGADEETVLNIYREQPELTEEQAWEEYDRRTTGTALESPTQTDDILLPFKTSEGEVYGFVTPEGEIYLDTDVINEEHPIHEYTHLWDRSVQKRNPALWKRGINLMKQIPLWNEIANSDQYGAKWKENGITGNKLINLIASEVHSRLVGKEGAEIIRNLAKEKGNKNIITKLKQWLLDFWKELKGTFGTWSNEELNNLTLEQFNMMTIRDFAEGVSLNDITSSNEFTYSQLLDIQKEMDDIKQQAITDGIFMKAPNGQPTNLNERQWLQVRTKEFKEWFGDWENDPNNASKVVDENGEPLVVYHTGASGITSFRTEVYDENDIPTGIPNAIYTTDSHMASTSYNYAESLLNDWWENEATFEDSHEQERESVKEAMLLFFDGLLTKNFTNEDDFWREYIKIHKNSSDFDKWFLYESYLTYKDLAKDFEEFLVKKEYDSKDSWLNSRLAEEFSEEMFPYPKEPDFYSQFNTYSLFVRMINPKIIDAGEKSWNNINYNGKKVSTRDLEYEFEQSEYDGVIVRNVFDYGGATLPERPSAHTVFISYSNTYVKSATDNNGEFSITDNNIQMYIENGENENTAALEQLQLAYTKQQEENQRQINNLLDSDLVSATELRHIADQVAWLISDHITDLQTKEGYAKEQYKDRVGDAEFSTMSRADIVRKIGAQNIMNWCRDTWFDTRNNQFDFDIDDMFLLDLIKDNWNGIMLLAQNMLLTIEDFSIVNNPITGVSEVNTDLTTNPDDFNSPQDTASIEENEGSQQEHWQVENRTLDVISTMTQQVKLALMKCLKIDNDGNPIISRLGIKERMDIREATKFILKNTQGALTLESMVNELISKSKDNQWLNQIIQRLNDKTGKEADFQSQFFSAFSKHFQPYSIVKLIDGKYESVLVNENPALSDAISQVVSQFQMNDHPMFTFEGINKKTFEDFKNQIKELEKFTHSGYNIEKESDKKDASETLGYISSLLGYYVTPDIVAANLNAETFKDMYSSLIWISKAFEKNLTNKTYDPFKFKGNDSIRGNLKKFLKPITAYFDDISVASVFDNGKMYQSYITPSYMTKLMAKIAESDVNKFNTFMQEEFGKYDWFRDQSQFDQTRGWKNSLIESLSRDKETREKFKHKVQLNFDKKTYMKTMDDIEYTLSLITEFLSEFNPTGKRQWAWYRLPMLSNKPSSEYLRMERFVGPNYKDSISDKIQQIFDQELSRIQTVKLRNYSKENQRYIKNLDKNGKRFCFLDFMNDYLDGSKQNTELGKLINAKINGEKADSGRLLLLSKAAIKNAMEQRVTQILKNWESQGILDTAKKISNIGTSKDEVRSNLENFIWNDTLAAMNIMELTITDIAYYKDAEDLQKRLAQLHAPGNRGNVMATDYEGKLVSDGFERTFYLNDFDTFVSNIVDNVSIVFDRKIEAARRRGAESEAKGLIGLKDSLVRPRTYKEDGSIDDEGGAFWNINVADAQAYNSPTSYRKKAFIFGKWSKQAEDIYQKLRKGEYNYNDLKVAFQPLKPFVYSQIEKSTGVEGAPMRNLKMGVQNKNSEYLLIMADAMLQGEDTGKPNILRAIYEVMEESHYDNKGNYKTNGIDTVQFVSAVKAGETGVININKYLNEKDGEAIAKKVLKESIYKTTTTINQETGELVETTGYNKDVIQEIPFEDYCLQQEVPQHFREHGDGQIHGSQLRYIVVSELSDYNDFGEKVTYNVDGRKLSVKEFKKEYEDTIAANIKDSIDELAEMLDLNIKDAFGNIDRVKRNITLSKLLQKEILSSPRYGIDLYQACSVDENGKFRIPLGDPIQSKRVEQLINSIIKNHVNKQKIAGGPVVQVSNFGTSKQLNIRFKNRNKEGELLMTRSEWENSTSPSKEATYKEYIKKNQGGIAHFEVFAPIYANELFTKFADKNGVINTEAIEMLSPELLKMIGYRIPTEAKYSAAPLKIVGFLPKEAGDGIMLPYDITLLNGSDFDVDKEYLMRKEYNIKATKTPLSEIANDLHKILEESKKNNIASNIEIQKEIKDTVKQFLLDPFNKKSFIENSANNNININESTYKKLLETFIKGKYVLENPPEIRTQRNNKIVDMTYEVLSHENSAAEMLNPGGFDQQKKMGYMVSVAKTTNIPWAELQKMKISELKDLANKNKNLMFIDTHIQFYKQNNAAGSLIGIFAVNRIAHSILEGEELSIDIQNVCGLDKGKTFTVAGMEFKNTMPIDVVTDISGQSIGKVLGSLVASAADAVKDPILNLMNINSTTAGILTSLIRLGMPFDDAALFLSQNIISQALNNLSKQKLNKKTSFTKVVNEMIQDIKNRNKIDSRSPINSEPLTKKELIDGLKSDNDNINYKVLQSLSKFIKIAETMRMPTMATRFNSMSSAVGPLIIDNLITESKINKLSANSNILDKSGNIISISDILKNHPILQQFARTLGIAEDLFDRMPANSTGFKNILNAIEGTSLSDTLINDRKLLSKLSDFYQSYLIVAGNVIDASRVSDVINKFPKEFIDKNYGEKYKDNPLIQSIKLSTEKSGRIVLKLNTTGLDIAQKERLGSGWTDLHKVNPELSFKLFEYCFFRGGIGFNPKTFMNLVPIYVKERIPNYIETFEKLPFSDPENIIDQFVRHNWNNKNLIRHIDVQKDKEHPFSIGTINGTDFVLADMEKLNNKYRLGEGDYIVLKNFNSNEDTLYKITSYDENIGNDYVLKQVDPLGGNGEFIEITIDGKEKSIENTTKAIEEDSTSDVVQREQSEITAETEEEDLLSDPEQSEELLYKIYMTDNTTKEQATQRIEKLKNRTDKVEKSTREATKKFIRDRMETLGLEVDQDKIDEIYEQLC